jgi:hypothetical protein
MQLIKPIIRGHAKSFVPKVDATKAYNDYLQEELKSTVWTSCISWYHTGMFFCANQIVGRLIAFRSKPSRQTHDLASDPDLHVVDDANTNLAGL